MRVVVVPSTLALLPEYASIDDPIADLREAVVAAVAWLVEDGPPEIVAATEAARRIGVHLVQAQPAAPSTDGADARPGLLVVANGSATRTEKAPGYLDARAAAFDDGIGRALAHGEAAALGHLDVALAEELWAPDAAALERLAGIPGPVIASVDYDDDPFGVQYWVVRWDTES